MALESANVTKNAKAKAKAKGEDAKNRTNAALDTAQTTLNTAQKSVNKAEDIVKKAIEATINMEEKIKKTKAGLDTLVAKANAITEEMKDNESLKESLATLNESLAKATGAVTTE